MYRISEMCYRELLSCNPNVHHVKSRGVYQIMLISCPRCFDRISGARGTSETITGIQQGLMHHASDSCLISIKNFETLWSNNGSTKPPKALTVVWYSGIHIHTLAKLHTAYRSRRASALRLYLQVLHMTVVCASPSCLKEASKMACPICLRDYGRSVHFCDQQCYKDNFVSSL